jgi:hypothetical protein
LLDVPREEGDPDARLTAAAILILPWAGRFGEADELTRELIARDGPPAATCAGRGA